MSFSEILQWLHAIDTLNSFGCFERQVAYLLDTLIKKLEDKGVTN